MATIFKQLSADDRYTDTQKLTKGLFAGSGTLAGTSMFTASISASNAEYFYTIQDKIHTDTSATKYFDVGFGHYAGSGSDVSNGVNNTAFATKAVYQQLANIVLDDPRNKFTFSDVSGSDTGTEVEYVYATVIKTAQAKDRLHTKWTVQLVGNDGASAWQYRSFTNWTGSRYPSIAGDYYKVVSGSGGTAQFAGGGTTYGHFYPDLNLIVWSGIELSGSLTGPVNALAKGDRSGSLFADTHWGLAPDLRVDGNADNAMKMVKAFMGGSVGAKDGSMTMRTEQDLNQTTYYCRLNHHEFNFTSNPSFIQSGSELGDILDSMVGDPTTYVSGIGLYNSFGELIATAKLNVPQKKNYNTELTIGVKIDG